MLLFSLRDTILLFQERGEIIILKSNHQFTREVPGNNYAISKCLVLIRPCLIYSNLKQSIELFLC